MPKFNDSVLALPLCHVPCSIEVWHEEAIGTTIMLHTPRMTRPFPSKSDWPEPLH